LRIDLGTTIEELSEKFLYFICKIKIIFLLDLAIGAEGEGEDSWVAFVNDNDLGDIIYDTVFNSVFGGVEVFLEMVEQGFFSRVLESYGGIGHMDLL